MTDVGESGLAREIEALIAKFKERGADFAARCDEAKDDGLSEILIACSRQWYDAARDLEALLRARSPRVHEREAEVPKCIDEHRDALGRSPQPEQEQVRIQREFQKLEAIIIKQREHIKSLLDFSRPASGSTKEPATVELRGRLDNPYCTGCGRGSSDVQANGHDDECQFDPAASVYPQLFNAGEFTLHSGAKTAFKINCDALSDPDIKALAAQIAGLLHPFGSVEGVPRGGIRLAKALERYSVAVDPVLIVDDVLTTGASMEKQRAGREAIGAVIFARGLCPSWVTPLFTFAASVSPPKEPLIDLTMIKQLCLDLNEAHNEILRLQGVKAEDYDAYDWPEWSGPANSIRWAERLLNEPLSKTSQRKDMEAFEHDVIGAFSSDDFKQLPSKETLDTGAISGCPSLEELKSLPKWAASVSPKDKLIMDNNEELCEDFNPLVHAHCMLKKGHEGPHWGQGPYWTWDGTMCQTVAPIEAPPEAQGEA